METGRVDNRACSAAGCHGKELWSHIQRQRGAGFRRRLGCKQAGRALRVYEWGRRIATVLSNEYRGHPQVPPYRDSGRRSRLRSRCSNRDTWRSPLARGQSAGLILSCPASEQSSALRSSTIQEKELKRSDWLVCVVFCS